ncbi:MAG: STAS domain-containing protein [Actinomycetota bacterium]
MNQSPESHDSDHFSVQVILEGEVAQLLLSGELDVATVPLLEDHLTAAEADGAKTILIDLALVTFMDSSGLHSFVRAARRAGERGKRLAFANCPDAVRKVFELTGTGALLDGGTFTNT